MSDIEPRIHPNGTSALMALERWRPDLVVLDLALPDMDGRIVLSQIRQRHPALPVLVYSGDSEALSKLELEAHQALTVLHKNSDFEAFMQLVPTLLKRRNGDRGRSLIVSGISLS